MTTFEKAGTIVMLVAILAMLLTLGYAVWVAFGGGFFHDAVCPCWRCRRSRRRADERDQRRDVTR